MVRSWYLLLTMATHPVSYVKAHLSAVLETARSTGEPVVITQNGEGAAVLQDLASYEAQRRTLAMLKLVAQGERDIARGRTVKQRDVFRGVRERLRSP
jgi:prevent-host-death family protein